MPDRNEAQRLWQEMCQVERTPCKSEEDFKVKRKEMKRLKAAYDKACGLTNPTNSVEWNEAVARKKISRQFRGEPDGPETTDTM